MAHLVLWTELLDEQVADTRLVHERVGASRRDQLVVLRGNDGDEVARLPDGSVVKGFHCRAVGRDVVARRAASGVLKCANGGAWWAADVVDELSAAG